jgi:hypothetical protein
LISAGPIVTRTSYRAFQQSGVFENGQYQRVLKMRSKCGSCSGSEVRSEETLQSSRLPWSARAFARSQASVVEVTMVSSQGVIVPLRGIERVKRLTR